MRHSLCHSEPASAGEESPLYRSTEAQTEILQSFCSFRMTVRSSELRAELRKPFSSAICHEPQRDSSPAPNGGDGIKPRATALGMPAAIGFSPRRGRRKPAAVAIHISVSPQ